MGSLAFLRRLCTAPDAAEWPRRMQTLLEAEGTTPGRRERIAGAYNRGFSAFGLTYNTCTPSAVEATNRYVKEGDQITRNLVTRYGGERRCRSGRCGRESTARHLSTPLTGCALRINPFARRHWPSAGAPSRFPLEPAPGPSGSPS